MLVTASSRALAVRHFAHLIILPTHSRWLKPCLKKCTHTRNHFNMVAEHGCDMPWRAPQEQISERICEQIVDFQVPQNDRDLHGTVEQIPDILVPETSSSLVKLPETVSDDKIQQRTAEHIAVISVPQDAKELVEVSEVFPQDRSQQYFLEQINETPDVSLAEKVLRGLSLRRNRV